MRCLNSLKKALIHLISQLSLTASPQGEANPLAVEATSVEPMRYRHWQLINCAVTATDCCGFVCTLVTELTQ